MGAEEAYEVDAAELGVLAVSSPSKNIRRGFMRNGGRFLAVSKCIKMFHS